MAFNIKTSVTFIFSTWTNPSLAIMCTLGKSRFIRKLDWWQVKVTSLFFEFGRYQIMLSLQWFDFYSKYYRFLEMTTKFLNNWLMWKLKKLQKNILIYELKMNYYMQKSSRFFFWIQIIHSLPYFLSFSKKKLKFEQPFLSVVISLSIYKTNKFDIIFESLV